MPPATALPLDARVLWSLDALTAADVGLLLQSARRLERAARSGTPCRSLRGKRIARVGPRDGIADDGAFDRAAAELGAQLTRVDAGVPKTATEVRRTSQMLGRLYDAIDCCNGLPAAQLDGLQRETGVPVFNGLASATHPLRALGPLVELQSLAGREPRGLRVALAAGDAPGQAALRRLAALAGVELVPLADGAEFVVEADGHVHPAGAPGVDGQAAADAARDYALQALLLSTIA